ncbi:MAG: hypothetical protein Q9M92_03745 [Enterobacterales bacterium]|nr:hypothetical protein [Enterobacterales bacterium]
MKSIFILSLIVAILSSASVSSSENNTYYNKPHTNEFIEEFFTLHAELKAADSFIYLAKTTK